MTIRQAVDVIARFGTAPVSESALRSRIRSRRLGVAKVNGRLYTNPLNLVAAGLVPVELLTDTALPGAIDDSDLYEWIGPPSLPSAPAGGKATGEEQRPVGGDRDEGLPAAEEPFEANLISPRPADAVPASAVVAPDATRRTGTSARRAAVGLLVAVVVGVVVAGLVAGDRRSASPARDLVRLRDPVARAGMLVAEAAGRSRLAIRLAATLGEPATVAAVRDRAGAAALSRSRAALEDRRLADARWWLREARQLRAAGVTAAISRTARSVLVGRAIDREAAARERRIRARAQARRQRTVAATARAPRSPSVAAPSQQRLAGSSGSAGGAGATGSTGGAGGGGGSSSTGSRDPEFM